MSELRLGAGTDALTQADLPQDWHARQLSDFCSFSQGGRLGLTKQEHYRSSGIPAYSAAGQDGFVDVAEFRDIDAVVLSAIGANCGRCFLAQGDWTTLANVQVIIPDAALADARFVHYRVNRDDYWPRSGSAQPFIKPSDMKACWIALPHVEQQKKIAQILDTLDTAIRETEALIDKLKAVKQGLLHDLLTRGIDANGQLRPPQSEAPQLYKESPLGWIPREWEATGLASVAPKDRSAIRTGPFGSSLKGEHWREIGRPVVTIGSLGDGVFIERELLFIDEKTAEQLVDFELLPGDIAFSRVADVGRSVVITEKQRGWIMSSNFMRISVDSEKARPRLLQLLLASSVLVRNQIRMTVNSAGRDVANSAVLMALRFPWPLPGEQDQIIERVESFEGKIAMEEAQHQKLLAAKEGLMNDLLTGRVRVISLLESTQASTGA